MSLITEWGFGHFRSSTEATFWHLCFGQILTGFNVRITQSRNNSLLCLLHFFLSRTHTQGLRGIYILLLLYIHLHHSFATPRPREPATSYRRCNVKTRDDVFAKFDITAKRTEGPMADLLPVRPTVLADGVTAAQVHWYSVNRIELFEAHGALVLLAQKVQLSADTSEDGINFVAIFLPAAHIVHEPYVGAELGHTHIIFRINVGQVLFDYSRCRGFKPRLASSQNEKVSILRRSTVSK